MKVLVMPPLKPCPFCGADVRRVRGIAGLFFFKCTNTEDCGAVVSFDCDPYNYNPKETHKAFNRRYTSDGKKGGHNDGEIH